MENIAIYGGSFNPPHLAHAWLIDAAINHFNFDKVILIPVGTHGNKKMNDPGKEHRFNMTKLWAESLDKIEVSDYEINSSETSYTYKTIQHFAKLYPKDKIHFLMGADQANSFHLWKEPEIIINHAKLCITNRAESQQEEIVYNIKSNFPKAEVEFFDLARIDLSSTHIRNLAKSNKNISLYLLPEVKNYIENNNLYQ